MYLKCDSCMNSFSTVPVLRNHINRVHEGQKNYKCDRDACEMLFFNAKGLKQHTQRVEKSYSSRQSLKKHISTIHEGNKDYKCDSCFKCFPDAGYLKKQIYTVHKGYKDYKCESCDKSFSQKGDLKVHYRTQRIQM